MTSTLRRLGQRSSPWAWVGYLKLNLESIALVYIHVEALTAAGLRSAETEQHGAPMPMSAQSPHSLVSAQSSLRTV